METLKERYETGLSRYVREYGQGPSGDPAFVIEASGRKLWPLPGCYDEKAMYLDAVAAQLDGHRIAEVPTPVRSLFFQIKLEFMGDVRLLRGQGLMDEIFQLVVSNVASVCHSGLQFKVAAVFEDASVDEWVCMRCKKPCEFVSHNELECSLCLASFKLVKYCNACEHKFIDKCPDCGTRRNDYTVDDLNCRRRVETNRCVTIKFDRVFVTPSVQGSLFKQCSLSAARKFSGIAISVNWDDAFGGSCIQNGVAISSKADVCIDQRGHLVPFEPFDFTIRTGMRPPTPMPDINRTLMVSLNAELKLKEDRKCTRGRDLKDFKIVERFLGADFPNVRIRRMHLTWNGKTMVVCAKISRHCLVAAEDSTVHPSVCFRFLKGKKEVWYECSHCGSGASSSRRLPKYSNEVSTLFADVEDGLKLKEKRDLKPIESGELADCLPFGRDYMERTKDTLDLLNRVIQWGEKEKKTLKKKK